MATTVALGGARERAEECATHGRCDGQPSPHVADETHDQIEQAVGSLTARHDLRGKNEHRYGHESGGRDATDHLLNQRVGGSFRKVHDEGHERRRHERHLHRKAEKEENDQDADEEPNHGGSEPRDGFVELVSLGVGKPDLVVREVSEERERVLDGTERKTDGCHEVDGVQGHSQHG